MTKFEEWKIDESVDIICGGTPCQAFSVAGKRGGMDDARGQLSLKFVEIVARYRPRWVVWENVPGVFSSGGGADFGSFLGALTGRDVQVPADGWGNSGVLEGIPDAYGVAWRTLDAQYFGVPQRRRRVFVVGHLGDWRRAAAVLFERESLCGHPPPSRQAGEGTARGLEFGPSGGGFTDLNPTLDARAKDGPIRNQLAGAVLDRATLNPETMATLLATDDKKWGGNQWVKEAKYVIEPMVMSSGQTNAAIATDKAHALDCLNEAQIAVFPAAGKAGGGEFQRLETTHTLRADGFDASEDGTGLGTPLVPVAFVHQAGGTQTSLGFEPSSETTPTLPKCQTLAVAFAQNQVGEVRTSLNTLNTLNTNSNASGRNTPMVAFAQNTRDEVRLIGGDGSHVGALAAEPGTKQQSYIAGAVQVRRLTPRECERLQGFPDDYTRIPWRKAAAEDCPDGPRYKALGNSWAVPCARWIGERIQMVEKVR